MEQTSTGPAMQVRGARRLDGRVATITGAGRGLGEAIAQAFAREGASVVVSDVDAAAASRVAESLRADGASAISLRVDVSCEADAQSLADAAMAEFGALHIHVNNAGISTTKLFLDTTRAEFERILQVNLIGALLCAQPAARLMVKAGYGRIVNIASVSGQRGGVGRSAYGSSKAGLELLTKVMAVELAASGITVNGIAPAAVETELAAEHHDAATRAAYRYLMPQQRYGQPAEVADAAVFLASDEARHVCGHTLNVDGGFRAAGLMFSLGGTKPAAPPG